MQDQSSGERPPPHAIPSVAEIEGWIVKTIAGDLQISRDQIEADQPILSYGVDSMQVVSFVAQLEDWLGIRFSENPLEEHPTVESLSVYARHIANDQD
jgi:acyl carrier protein